MTLKTRENLIYLFVLGIPLLFLSIFFIVPIGQVIYTSFGNSFNVGEAYAQIIHTKVYLQVFQNTFYITIWVVGITLIIGYSLAFLLLRAPSRWFYLLLILLLSPLLMNQLSRNFAWIVILDNKGVINSFFAWLGVIHQPLELMYNRFGVIIVLIHGFVPVMALSIYSALSTIEKELPWAAYSMGATPFQTFCHIYFPLSLPGVAAGCFFVAILTFGYYITPAMLGGSKGIMIAKIIDQLLNRQGDAEVATAVSTILVLICLPSVFFLIKSFNALRRESAL